MQKKFLNLQKIAKNNVLRKELAMEKINQKEYQEFLEKHERCHYAQSLEWANIKNDWKNEICSKRTSM